MFTASTYSNRGNLKYEVDWFALAVDWLPDRMRKPLILNTLEPIISAIDLRFNYFLNDRTNAIIETAVNGQTMVLEKYLNMIFDPTNETIQIINTVSNFETFYAYKRTETPSAGDDIFIYRRGEVIPLTGTQEYVFKKEEIQLNYDFQVLIPAALAVFLNLQIIGAIVDRYKFSGTTYIIRII